MMQTVSPFRALPPLMKEIIGKDESVETNIAIEKDNKLTQQQGDKMMELIRKMILKTIQPSELVGAIQREIGLDEGRAKKLALDLLGRRFLAMEWYIGPVQPVIRQLGGNVETYLRETRKNYPEVFERPAASAQTGQESDTETALDDLVAEKTHPILKNFDERINTVSGKAEILLRLTGLSTTLEKAIQDGKFEKTEGDRLMQRLEAVSYAVNTRDLNLFEAQSIKRQLKRLITQIEGSK